MAAGEFLNHVLEGVNYIVVPAGLTEDGVSSMQTKMAGWLLLPADVHVFDFKSSATLPDGFFKSVKKFGDSLRSKNTKLISVNMSESLANEVKARGLEASFNRILKFPGDLYEKKTLTETEIRTLLFRYLAQAAFAAIETTLKSTVSCDENSSSKAEDVPLSQFDLISCVNVNNDFLKAEFRLCSSTKVLEKLAHAMMGKDAAVDSELMDSMALELLNLIYGHAKSNLNDQESFRLPSAIPRLIRKSEFHRIKRSPSAQIAIMPLVTPLGSLYVEVDFGNRRPS